MVRLSPRSAISSWLLLSKTGQKRRMTLRLLAQGTGQLLGDAMQSACPKSLRRAKSAGISNPRVHDFIVDGARGVQPPVVFIELKGHNSTGNWMVQLGVVVSAANQHLNCWRKSHEKGRMPLPSPLVHGYRWILYFAGESTDDDKAIRIIRIARTGSLDSFQEALKL